MYAFMYRILCSPPLGQKHFHISTDKSSNIITAFSPFMLLVSWVYKQQSKLQMKPFPNAHSTPPCRQATTLTVHIH